MSRDRMDERFHGWLRRKADLMRAGYAAGGPAGAKLHAVKGLVVAGMGGSGVAGRLVRDAVWRSLPVPILVVQDHDLPGCVGEGWVVLTLSYSGETEETLAVARSAAACGAQTIAFTTGGTLAQMADTVVEQPHGYPPRAALGFMWMGVLGALEAAGLLDAPVPLDEAVRAVHNVDAECGAEAPAADNPARRLAARLFDRVPCIYATPRLDGVARFMAALLNENAKRIAFRLPLPEANHNDLVGWSGDRLRRHLAVVVFSDAREEDEIGRRVGYMRQEYRRWGVRWDALQVAPIGDTRQCIVAQAWAIHLAEYTSLYLAGQRGVDPADIAAVDGLKEVLRKEVPMHFA